ncbi:hypothetical protein K458DRAFT_196619 [Lentithecium fluviatile CBS 122367]|uniref:C2H2-type domain-containing protein n=1 Tax=Lentithecium fluviatile CBS 122367 TaxID=1168545 RepID=A0A6G1ICA1_9PLEO|nr:hypothetical protein K458DRAFT_196619 [Lentithecium fluviatile CBS 122367]
MNNFEDVDYPTTYCTPREETPPYLKTRSDPASLSDLFSPILPPSILELLRQHGHEYGLASSSAYHSYPDTYSTEGLHGGRPSSRQFHPPILHSPTGYGCTELPASVTRIDGVSPVSSSPEDYFTARGGPYSSLGHDPIQQRISISRGRPPATSIPSTGPHEHRLDNGTHLNMMPFTNFWHRPPTSPIPICIPQSTTQSQEPPTLTSSIASDSQGGRRIHRRRQQDYRRRCSSPRELARADKVMSGSQIKPRSAQHAGGTPRFSCENCSRSFGRNNDLKRH